MSYGCACVRAYVRACLRSCAYAGHRCECEYFAWFQYQTQILKIFIGNLRKRDEKVFHRKIFLFLISPSLSFSLCDSFCLSFSLPLRLLIGNVLWQRLRRTRTRTPVKLWGSHENLRLPPRLNNLFIDRILFDYMCSPSIFPFGLLKKFSATAIRRH